MAEELKPCPKCGEDEPYTGNCGTADSDTRALCKKTHAQQYSQRGEAVAWRVTGRGGITVTAQYPEWAEADCLLTITPLYTHPANAPADSRANRQPRTTGGKAVSEVKRYNMDVGKLGSVDSYESEHGRWVKREDYAELAAECERLRGALNRARKAESRPEFLQIIDAALSAKT